MGFPCVATLQFDRWDRRREQYERRQEAREARLGEIQTEAEDSVSSAMAALDRYDGKGTEDHLKAFSAALNDIAERIMDRIEAEDRI